MGLIDDLIHPGSQFAVHSVGDAACIDTVLAALDRGAVRRLVATNAEGCGMAQAAALADIAADHVGVSIEVQGEWFALFSFDEVFWIVSHLTKSKPKGITTPTPQIPLTTDGRSLRVRAWDAFAAHINWELSHGYPDGEEEDGCWLVHSVNGGRNDREWTLIGRGETPLDAALAALKSTAARERDA